MLSLRVFASMRAPLPPLSPYIFFFPSSHIPRLDKGLVVSTLWFTTLASIDGSGSEEGRRVRAVPFEGDRPALDVHNCICSSIWLERVSVALCPVANEFGARGRARKHGL